jgi:putative drug exporter of the RND superfamily
MGMSSALARASARRAWLVIATWALLVVTAVGTIALVDPTMTTDVGGSDSEAARAAEVADAQLPGTEPREAVVIHSDSATVDSAEFQQAFASMGDRLRQLGAKLSPTTPASSDGYAALLLFEIDEARLDDVTRAADELDADDRFDAAVFGPNLVDRDFHAAADADLRKGETFGVAAALVLLLLVFGTAVAALIPLVLGLVATVVGLAVVTLVGEVVELSVFVHNIVAAMGLALGIDYSLFVVSRYREERARGPEPAEAIAISGRTASHAVLVSGMAVAIALSSMILVSDRVLKSLAIGAGIVTAVAVLAALTLVPALLGLLGDGVNRFAVPRLGARVASGRASPLWSRLARRVTARPGIALVATTALLVALALPARDLELGSSGAAALPNSLEAKRGFRLLEHAFGSATSDRTRTVVSGDISSVEAENAIGRLLNRLDRDPLFFGPAEVDEAQDLAVVSFYVAGDPAGDQAIAAVRRLRTEYIAESRFPSSTDVLVGGPTAEVVDYVDSITGSWLRVIAFVLALSFALLAVAFRSLVVPLKAMVLNVLSASAAYGVLVLVFQHGVGANLLGLQETEKIEAWVPMLLVALLFGLSMDYHVFLLSRIREEYRASGDTGAAVSFGLVSTGRIITGAALIIVVAFAGLAVGDLVMFQQLGLGVAVALLLDATVVRVLLVPAAMRMLGRWNWYPSRLAHATAEAGQPLARVSRPSGGSLASERHTRRGDGEHPEPQVAPPRGARRTG